MARPREFNEEEVLARAMEVFWNAGFEGTSLDALEASMGMNRSSLYNTFGGKLELFCKALDAYSAGPCQELFAPLCNERGGEALRGYLNVLRSFVGSREASKGCMMVNTSLEAAADDSEVGPRVEAHFQKLRTGFLQAYASGIEEHSVNSALSPEEAADWLLTFVRGVLASAAAGESSRLLSRSIEVTAKQLGIGPL